MSPKRTGGARFAAAFAPSAISNFFSVEYDASNKPCGATGGGYILSKGTTTSASYTPSRRLQLKTVVNGDSAYNARTTRLAVDLLLSANKVRTGALELDQAVETPIGGGFGASGAAATSAVMAVSGVTGMGGSKREIAYYAHRAEILEQTGLGTVSVVFEKTGAGAITVPGEPGKAQFVNVPVPKDMKVVTAFIAPYDKKDALSSRTLSEKINVLGQKALNNFLADPTLDALALEGERFSRSLGLESPEVKKLIALAKAAGAEHASQNMIGYSIHSLVYAEHEQKLVDSLRTLGDQVRVDVFEVGSQRAGLMKG